MAQARQRIALFGGSFDPVHIGHLICARAVREQAGLDRVIFIPARQPPHKPGRALAPATDRLEMLRLAIASEDGFDVSDHELTRPGPSYTLYTVEHFQRLLGEAAEVFWIIGSDSVPELPTWHRIDELLQRCVMLVARRPGWDPRCLDELRSRLNPAHVERLARHVLPTPVIDVSATDIRRRIAEGRSIRYLTPEAVIDYIRSRSLYAGGSPPASSQSEKPP